MSAPFPVPGYETAWRDSWGECRPITGGCTRRHEGQDITAPEGTPVIAVADGVTSKQSGGAGGNALNLDTADGLRYYYAHFSRYPANVPGPVRAGDVVGFVGATGSATGPHLHFSIYRNGTAVNPASFLRGAKPGSVSDIPYLPDPLDPTEGGILPANPFDVASDLAGAVTTLGSVLFAPITYTTSALAWLADRDNWARIAQVGAGITLAGLGLTVLFRDVLGDAATVGLNPGQAVQGLADEGNQQ